MYNLEDGTGSLTAMLLPSVTRQFEFLYHPNQHDAVFIPNTLMCLNWCDKACNWNADHKWSIWSTQVSVFVFVVFGVVKLVFQHVYFVDPKTITCSSRCPN